MNTGIVMDTEAMNAGEYDVIVVGGGIAGVSAAVAAARAGKSVLLLEKSILMGGLATLGLVTYYEPLCDGLGHKIAGGLAEELLHRSIRYGFGRLPDGWAHGVLDGNPEKRYDTRFSPALFVLALDELVENEGVTILFDTLFCKAVMQGNHCKGVIAESKSGRQFFAGKILVDATGDLDVMISAGVPYETQNNYLSFFAAETDLAQMQKAWEQQDIRLATRFRMWGSNRLGAGNPEPPGAYDSMSAEMITRFVLDGRKLARAEYQSDSDVNRDLVLIPGMAQVRTTRRLSGEKLLREEDADKRFNDSIGAIPDYWKKGVIYEIPYGTLISKEFPNLITAGRSISSEGHAWELTREIPSAALTGEAAGTAAALAIDTNMGLCEISLDTLQQRLMKNGVRIHI